MAQNVGAIYYDLKLNTKDFEAQSQKVASKAQNIGNGMKSVGKKMAMGVTLPVMAFGALAIKSASDLTETINKVDVAFGKNAEEVKAWSKTTIDKFGMAGSSAMESASLFGDMGTSMGLSTSEASAMSMSMTGLAGDLASFKNIGTEQATTALAGVFTGETESLKKLGIVMTQTQLEQFAMTQGITKSMKEMTQAEKVQLRYAYVMAKTKNAQGDFARTSEGTANQMRMAGERFKELREEIGARLIPIANKFLEWGQKAMAWFGNLSPQVKNIIMVVIGLTAVLGPLLIIMGSIATAVTAISLPVLGVVAGIALLVAGAIFLEKKFGILSKTFKFLAKWAKKIWHWFENNILPTLKTVAEFVGKQLATAWREFITALKKAWEAIQPLKPVLKAIAMVIGGVLLVALGLIIGVIVSVVAIFVVVGIAIARLIGWFMKLTVWLINVWKSIWDFTVKALILMVEFFINLWNTVVEWGGKVIGWFLGLHKKVLDAFIGAIKWLWDVGKNIVQGLVDGVKSMASAVWNGIKLVADKIGSFFAGAWNWLWDTGKAIIEGLIGGIKSMAGAVWDAVTGVASGIGDAVTGFFGINSPSKLFSGYGKDMMQGLAQGIQSNAMLPQVALDTTTSGLSAGIGTTGGMPNQTNTSIYGDINIGSQTDSDYFFRTLSRNEELSSKGLASRAGTV